MIRALSREFEAERERIATYNRGNASGRWVTRLYTAATDNHVRALVERASKPGKPFARPLALVAVGGYGRKELCPHSDIDLLVLTPKKEQGVLEEALREVLYPLWDVGLKVGHKSGTIRQVLASADEDFTGQTAVLDTRFLAGNRELYEEFRRKVHARVPKWRKSYRSNFIEAMRKRNRRWGSDVFLLEPHLKEGRGGLRDLNFLQWSGVVFRKLSAYYDLLLSGFITPEHYEDIVEAHDFLLRMRVGLHSIAGRAEDRLVFELQEPLARSLGYRSSRKTQAAERMMSEYYRHALRLARLTTLYQRRLVDVNLDVEELRASEGRPPKLPRGPWSWFESHVIHQSDADLEDPAVFLGLMRSLQSDDARLHVDTTEALQALGPRIARRLRNHPSFGAAVYQILGGERPYNSLQGLYYSGMLERLIPEFTDAKYRVQYSRMHLYTVDVHLLYAVRELQHMWTGEGDWPESIRKVARELPRRAPVVAGTLLHDIAKSEGIRHSSVGADWASAILGRLGWRRADIQLAVDLVRLHLVFPATAMNRDLSDPATIDAFVAAVPSIELLDALLCLVAADSRATNPSLARPWRLQMYLELWRQARARLEGGTPAEPPDEAAWTAALRTALAPEAAGDRLDRLVARMGRERFAAAPEFLQAGHVEEGAAVAMLMARVLDDDETVVLKVRQKPDLGVSQAYVVAKDQGGLFAQQCAVFAAHGLNILAADIASHDDGVAVNSFVLAPISGVSEISPRTWKRIEDSLHAVLSGKSTVRELLARSRPRGGRTKAELEVRVDHRASRSCMVVDVHGKDRPWLLYDLARSFTRSGYSVRSAHITTVADEVRDAFYLLDGRGTKPGVDESVEVLNERLRAL